MRKDILELKKRFKKDKCTFTKMTGCFVNSNKEIILELNETFLNLDEDDYFKYLEIAKKVLSGTVDNNLLKLDFSDSEENKPNRQLSLIELKKSKLKDENILKDFYSSIIDNYEYPENYLILVFHDVYDIITKTSDNLKLDESEEVFEYILCAICPISLSAPGLRYYEDENIIKSRLRDWIVEQPINGFLYPAFIDRSADIDSVIYYTKNTKDIHPELITDSLGCHEKDTISIQKDKFQSLVVESIDIDEEEANELYIEIQDNLNNLIEENKANSETIDKDPIKLTKEKLQDILMESGLPESNIEEIENYYMESFNNSIPVAESLIDKKFLKISEQKKKEKTLEKEVKSLKAQLEETNSLSNHDENYDIILQAKSDKIDQIKSEIIDGQEYIMIPINKEEKTIINEIK